jgi:hypothetical protein
MTRFRTPFLIKVLALLLGFLAATTGLMILVTLFSSSGSYYLNGDMVTRAEFLARAVPWLSLVGVVAGTLGWALWTDRRWARHALVASWAAGTLTIDVRFWNDPTIDADAVFVTVFSLICLLPVIWYFYLKRSVTAYYRALAQRRTPHAA